MKWKFVSGAKHKSKTFGGLLILSIVRQVFWISTIWCSSNYEKYLKAITMQSLRLNICFWGKLGGGKTCLASALHGICRNLDWFQIFLQESAVSLSRHILQISVTLKRCGQRDVCPHFSMVLTIRLQASCCFHCKSAIFNLWMVIKLMIKVTCQAKIFWSK